MDDLISRQATIRFIRDKVSLSLFMKRSVDKADKACMELCEMLDRELPSAEVEPVKHGRWEPVTNGRGGFECSICHSYAPSYKNGEEHISPYCPYCGAKMEPISASPENGKE